MIRKQEIVVKLDSDFNVIAEYKTASEAAETENISYNKINRNVRGLHSHADGQLFKYKSRLNLERKLTDKQIVARLEGRSFEFSGTDSNTRVKATTSVGSNVRHNQSIINLFAKEGIYDFVHYLFLECWRGQTTLHLRYFNNYEYQQIDLSGKKSSEVIKSILTLTVHSGKTPKFKI